MRSGEIYLIKIFLYFEFRVMEGDVADTSQASLAVVVTVGVVGGLALTALSLALLTLIRTNREDTKSRLGKVQRI